MFFLMFLVLITNIAAAFWTNCFFFLMLQSKRSTDLDVMKALIRVPASVLKTCAIWKKREVTSRFLTVENKNTALRI